MDRKYCYACNKKVEYTVKEKEIEAGYNGIKISYNGYEVTCNECKKIIYHKKYSDFNVRASNDAFRKEMGIISYYDVIRLLDSYGYKELDISENSYKILKKGLTPSKETSDKLKLKLGNTK